MQESVHINFLIDGPSFKAKRCRQRRSRQFNFNIAEPSRQRRGNHANEYTSTTLQFRRFGRRFLARSASASLSSRECDISRLPAPSDVSIIKTLMRFLRRRR